MLAGLPERLGALRLRSPLETESNLNALDGAEEEDCPEEPVRW